MSTPFMLEPPSLQFSTSKMSKVEIDDYNVSKQCNNMKRMMKKLSSIMSDDQEDSPVAPRT